MTMMMKRTAFVLLIGVAILAVGCATPHRTVSGQSNNGLFRIICDPGGAEVYVDGQFVGPASRFDGSPGLLEIAAGTHRLEIRKEGYAPFIRDVYSSNAVQEVRVTLSPIE